MGVGCYLGDEARWTGVGRGADKGGGGDRSGRRRGVIGRRDGGTRRSARCVRLGTDRTAWVVWTEDRGQVRGWAHVRHASR